jgi:enterochelin esterase-like enzyme
VSLLAFAALGAGTIVAAPAAYADESVEAAIVEGATVTANPDSPTGYTVTFVYHNPNATQVRLGGDLTLLGLTTGTTRYQPEAFQTGRYHAGGTEFLRDMTKDANGYWSVTVPLHAGNLSYWYRVWDPTQGWTNKRIWDPASSNPRPAGDSFRVRNNDVLDSVQVPYDAKQNDPILQTRAQYELPAADPADRGTVQYVEYTTILGDDGHYLGVYLPAGYDPDREEPYKVVYLAHGIFGDETDFMIPVGVPNILDNMTARGEIEPTVVITMGNHFTGTSLGFSSYNQTNAANNLVNVILPFVEENYNVSNEREGRAYGGFSYGGMTGGVVIKNYPTTFGYYGHFSGNPSLTAADYDKIAAAVGTNGLSVFLGNGVFEGSLTAQNAIAANYMSRGIPAGTAQVPGAHDGMTAGQLFTIFARDYLWKNADTRDGLPVEAVIPEGEDGVLALTVADFGAAVQLSAPENAGDRLRFTGALPEVTVTDSRTSAQAGEGGWAVSGQADAFVSAHRTVQADHFGWTPKVLTPRAGVTAGAVVATVLGGGSGLGTANQLASANADGRWGSAVLGADLLLEVPVDTQPGTYTGMLTLSLFPVD